jgi:hypothetical protein
VAGIFSPSPSLEHFVPSSACWSHSIYPGNRMVSWSGPTPPRTVKQSPSPVQCADHPIESWHARS